MCRTYTLIPCSPTTTVRPLANLSMVNTEGYCTTCPRACSVALVDTALSLMRQHWSGIFSYDITPQSSLSASTLIWYNIARYFLTLCLHRGSQHWSASYHRTTMSHHVFTISHIPVSTSPMMLTYMGIIQHEYGYKEWDESDEIKIRCWHMQWHSSSIAYQSVTRHRHTDTQYSILINSIFQTLFGGESLNCFSSSSNTCHFHKFIGWNML